MADSVQVRALTDSEVQALGITPEEEELPPALQLGPIKIGGGKRKKKYALLINPDGSGRVVAYSEGQDPLTNGTTVRELSADELGTATGNKKKYDIREIGGQVIRIDPETGQTQVVYQNPAALSPEEQQQAAREEQERKRNQEARQQAAEQRAQAAEERAQRTEQRQETQFRQQQVDKDYDYRLKAWEDMINIATQQASQVQTYYKNLVEMGKLKREEAEKEWERWWTTNIDFPLKMMQEARLRAQEQRQAEEERYKRLSDFASDETARLKFAYEAGQDAVKNAQFLVPYMAGPTFGKSFAAALNALAKGETYSGWSESDFKFKAPDFDQIAEQAIAKALEKWSPYAQRLLEAQQQLSQAGLLNIPTADYSQYPVANPAEAPQVPKLDIPPPPPPVDLTELLKQRPVYPGPVSNTNGT